MSLDKNLCLCGCKTELPLERKYALGHNGRHNREWIKIGHKHNTGKSCPLAKKKKISESLKGHSFSEETIKKISCTAKKNFKEGKRKHWAKGLKKESNPLYGRKRLNISYRFKGKGNPFYGRKHEEETKIKMKEWHKINRPNFGEYPSIFNEDLKENIRKRDNYICQNCNITEEEHIIVFGRVLAVHHINYIKEDCSKNNLITLCISCNIRANYNKEYWKKMYNSKMDGIYVKR